MDNLTMNYNIAVWSTSIGIETGTTTFEVEETPEEARTRKKKLIKSIVDDDKYLLQELLSELRKDKIDQLLNNDT